MPNALVSVKNLRKIYGHGDTATEVLQGINLDIQAGEFVAIMGPSGSGKSTLMHILGLLDRPTTGIYELAGERVDHLSEDRLADLRNRKLGFVFQSFNLLARTTTLENVELPLVYNREVPLPEQRVLATNALQSVGLSHRLQALPNQLSGGEQQRVAIARALVSNPQIIFADEPTGNLDTKNSIEIMQIFRTLNAAGHTIILVTHEQDIAKFAHRVITLRDGLIVSDELNQTPTGATLLPVFTGQVGQAVASIPSKDKVTTFSRHAEFISASPIEILKLSEPEALQSRRRVQDDGKRQGGGEEGLS